MELIALGVLVLFMATILAIVLWEATRYKPRVRHNHAHTAEHARSQHEVAGKHVKVYECEHCGLHFSVKQ